MDFLTIKNKLINNGYDNEEEFRDDMMLICDNCLKFNGDGN
jgi:hypothetical protein